MASPSEPIDDGGPAFPQAIAFNGNGDAVTPGSYGPHLSGLSLRDYFAATAMQSMVANSGSPDETAAAAYRFAEAMLRARGAR